MSTRKPCIWRCIWPLIALAAAAPMAACAATPSGSVATVRTPIEIATPPAPGGAGGRDYLEIVVRAYRPATDGAVQIVVAHAQPGGAEIARFGLFPERPFSAAEPARAQRFSFPLNAVPGRIAVRLVPVSGAGDAAFADVSARIVRHD